MPTEETRPLVLIADPDPECSVLMARQLEWAGYGVITTGFDAEALELIEARRPDALVVEAMLPERSGYVLTRELREQPHNRLMPIVMVSARAGKLDRDFAFTSGADDYVKKPFRYADLVSRLTALLPVHPPHKLAVHRLLRPAAQPAPAAFALG